MVAARLRVKSVKTDSRGKNAGNFFNYNFELKYDIEIFICLDPGFINDWWFNGESFKLTFVAIPF